MFFDIASVFPCVPLKTDINQANHLTQSSFTVYTTSRKKSREVKSMPKDFSKTPAARTIDRVAKTSAEKAAVVTVRMIHTDALLDYPHNGEDIDYTADLENSIQQLGFTDPIEVTAFGQSEGAYMIVSGHRRRAAGVRCGMELFPCIIKSFEDEAAVYNYVLLANSQRDSSKDPLLFCKRYKMHEAYLRESSFEGSVRLEISKRLGISVQQADRYNQMNKVIEPVWDMVRDETVGMSSVLPMAAFTPEEQGEIYDKLRQFLADGMVLSRERVKAIIELYREGKRENDMPLADDEEPEDDKPPIGELVGTLMNTDPGKTHDPAPCNRNSEMRRERDHIADEYDKMDADDERRREEDCKPEICPYCGR
jgi:ParB/RepB/Spo0J family partition protein